MRILLVVSDQNIAYPIYRVYDSWTGPVARDQLEMTISGHSYRILSSRQPLRQRQEDPKIETSTNLSMLQ